MPWSIINLNSARGAKYREYGSWLVGVSDRQSLTVRLIINSMVGWLTNQSILEKSPYAWLVSLVVGWIDGKSETLWLVGWLVSCLIGWWMFLVSWYVLCSKNWSVCWSVGLHSAHMQYNVFFFLAIFRTKTLVSDEEVQQKNDPCQVSSR